MKSRCFSSLIMALVAILTILLPTAGAAAATVPGTVRVALVKQASTLGFKVSGNYQLVDHSTGRVIIKLDQGESWHVKLQDGQIALQGRKDYGPFSGPIQIRELNFNVDILAGSGEQVERTSTDGLVALNGEGKTVSLNNTVIPAVSSAGGTTTLSGGGGLNLISLTDCDGAGRYRGNLEFRVENGNLSAVNELNIEDYLRGVVPAEIPASWPTEALKAQAVAARNYAMQRVESSRGRSYNVDNDQSSQVYRGYDAESTATDRAVEETRGVVMLNQGSLITAFFHSSSGGYIENSEDVWNSPLPYLKCKQDPYDKNDKYYNWQVSYTVEQLIEQLEKTGYEFKKVNDVEELTHTASGARVEKIAVEGEGATGEPLRVEISNADNVRIALGLKSALFTLKKVYDKDKKLAGLDITGSGWGHGLGLSQWGAYGMSKQGYNYQDILKYYYSGINLATSYGRSPAPSEKVYSERPAAWLGGN